MQKDARFSCGSYELQNLFKCAPVAFTALHAAPRNGRRTGKRWDRRVALKEGLVSVGVVLVCLWVLHRCVGGWCAVCAVSVCAVSVGFRLWTPRREGKDLSGKVGAVHGLREKQGQCLRAVLQ